MYDQGYMSSPDQVDLLPSASAVLKDLREQGFRLVVVTNQSGIGRGFFNHAQAAAVTERLAELLAEQGAWIDATYSCPHSPEDGCDCRKPKPGMLHRAAHELDLDLTRSFMVGDRISDCEAAEAAGCQPILLTEKPLFPDMPASWIVISQLSQLPDVIRSHPSSSLQMKVPDQR